MSIETQEQKEAYALGISLGQNAVALKMPFDIESLIAGFSVVVKAQTPEITEDEFKALINQLNEKVQAKAQENISKASAKFRAEGEEFLAKNGAKADIVTTNSGLQYEVIALNKEGDKPGPTSQVKVHYEGSLIDGTVFDSSYKRGEPATFGLNQVIKGWGEGLQHMTPGSVFRFFIPADLAYGDRGAGKAIPPGATLIFQVELIEIVG